MNRELKPAQIDAAHDLARHVSVTAGPGSGKTTVLVERYLHILGTHDVTVDQIVAITFTNRAANEMRERLRRELTSIAQSAAGAERSKWSRHKRTLDGAVITTIHGFCSRILREFPVEAGIDPRFRLLDEHQSAVLLETAVEEALTAFINSGHEAITRLTVGVGRQPLVAALIEMYRSMRNQGLTLERARQLTAENHAAEQDYATAVEDLNAAMLELAGKSGLSRAQDKNRHEAVAAWPSLRESLSSASTASPLAGYCQAIESFRETRPPARDSLKDLVNILDELIWNRNLGGRVPRLFFDLYAKQYALELIGVLERVEREVAVRKTALSALDFDDLQLETLRLLSERPEVLRRTSSRYRFFLVDEFQDTNGLQRELMNRLALSPRRANLFIVGDRKQSIYGFRGADVDVFREMSSALEAAGGQSKPLNLNFRSQPPLIAFFNHLFERIFTPPEDVDAIELNELGFVEHEPGAAAREPEDAAPLVEFLIDSGNEDETALDDWNARERDAAQLAIRIMSLVDEAGQPRCFQYSEIALLFRAMTEAAIYESALRRAGIPYQTVEGKGFYAREEIDDLIQLLRFLDNTTDETALAAVLRSPLCGLSDDVLLALRSAPEAREREDITAPGASGLKRRRGVRGLLNALRHHERIGLIGDEDHPSLDRARVLVEELVARRNRLGVAELLRHAISRSEYRTVIAAAFDGAQRLANVDKLFDLAERFEASGANMIRDFVRFVREFERSGARESEGQIDDSANAVRLMTIHQAKGLEFPVVIIPELQRRLDTRQDWWILDRHRGLTVKVPDGRGGRVIGRTMERFRERSKLREQFESMRLMYVAATRARDRLILSGSLGAERELTSGRHTWLSWICESLGIAAPLETKRLDIAEGVDLLLTVNLLTGARPFDKKTTLGLEPVREALASSIPDRFPLLRPIQPDRTQPAYRFSVTQLLNYDRCQRQYYFDRVLHAPSGDEVAFWNDAEAPEPPANLTATIRGAVIHRFCEKYSDGGSVDDCLKACLDEVLKIREAELAGRIQEINSEAAVRGLRPLAGNYLKSSASVRVAEALAEVREGGEGVTGVFSERHFRLRRPLGLLTGTIDKLMVRKASNGKGVIVEIIDFKTNRIRHISDAKNLQSEETAGAHSQLSAIPESSAGVEQLAFDFSDSGTQLQLNQTSFLPTCRGLEAEVNRLAADYQLQAQAYALAARELISDLCEVKVTLHFLDPNVEVSVRSELLEHAACSKAVDDAMLAMISSSEPESFPARPDEHCYSCTFRQLCPEGQWSVVSGNQRSAVSGQRSAVSGQRSATS